MLYEAPRHPRPTNLIQTSLNLFTHLFSPHKDWTIQQKGKDLFLPTISHLHTMFDLIDTHEKKRSILKIKMEH